MPDGFEYFSYVYVPIGRRFLHRRNPARRSDSCIRVCPAISRTGLYGISLFADPSYLEAVVSQ